MEKDSRFSGCPERPKRDIAIDGGGVFLFIYLIAAWGVLLGFGTVWEDQGEKREFLENFFWRIFNLPKMAECTEGQSHLIIYFFAIYL